MPTFTPPSEPYSQTDRHGSRLANRLMRYYGTMERGRNVFYLSNGVVTETDPDSVSVFWEQSAGSPYVLRVWYGGHHGGKVSAAEQTALEAAGYTVETRYLSLAGVENCFAYTPNSAKVQVDGVLDIRAHVALDEWIRPYDTSSLGNQVLMAQRDDTKSDSNGGGNSYEFTVQHNFATPPGSFRSRCITTAGTVTLGVSSVAPTVADGVALWVRLVRQLDGTFTFYTAPSSIDEPSVWTQLGESQTGVAGQLVKTTSSLFVGARLAHKTETDGLAGLPYRTVEEAAGKFYRVLLYDGDTVVADFDPDDAFTVDERSWVSKTGEQWFLVGDASLAVS